LLTLTAPEMTVLVGGLRVLKTTVGRSEHGVFTTRPEALTSDFFVNLLDMGTRWQAVSDAQDVFEGRDRATGALRWTGTRFDLIFGSNAQLRAVAEVCTSSKSSGPFGLVSKRHSRRVEVVMRRTDSPASAGAASRV
jgi:catalase-peroxidase